MNENAFCSAIYRFELSVSCLERKIKGEHKVIHFAPSFSAVKHPGEPGNTRIPFPLEST